MKIDSAAKNARAVVVMLTLVASVLVFHFWLPEKIEKKAETVLTQSETEVVAAADTTLPPSLLEYIENERAIQNSESDSIEDLEFVNNFDATDLDYSSEANEIIANRFKLPNWNNENQPQNDFSTPEELQDIVTFWTYIFGIYDKNYLVFYNSDNVGIVYSVLDFSDIGDMDNSLVGTFKAQMVSEETAKIRVLLKKVATQLAQNKSDLSQLSDDEARIAKLLLADIEYLDVSEKNLLDKLTYRYGFAHRIEKALKVSGRYMDEMRRIFIERGLPTELTVIPFVESAFNLEAHSHAGAAGIWQFIEATGKRYLRIDEYVDERFDPILAAYAAATHLSHEYKLLNSWALTINAYNTGPGRMLQAIKQLGTTDIGVIVKKFKGSGYGFDSRNYFPEILAALNVYKNKEFYFGPDFKSLPKQEFEYLATPAPMNIKQLARLSGISMSELSDMNISLKTEVLNGEKTLPTGYLLKIPPQAKQNVILAMQDLHSQVKTATHHVVEKGDTLQKIAKQYDLPVSDLAAMNQLLPNQTVTKGQIIQLLPHRDTMGLTFNKNGESDLVIPDDLQNPVF